MLEKETKAARCLMGSYGTSAYITIQAMAAAHLAVMVGSGVGVKDPTVLMKN